MFMLILYQANKCTMTPLSVSGHFDKNACIVTTSWDDGQTFDEKLSSLLLKYGVKGTFYIPRKWGANFVDCNLVDRKSVV